MTGTSWAMMVSHFLAEAALLAVVARRDAAEDLVDRRVRRQRAVEDVELTLEALRDGGRRQAGSWTPRTVKHNTQLTFPTSN